MRKFGHRTGTVGEWKTKALLVVPLFFLACAARPRVAGPDVSFEGPPVVQAAPDHFSGTWSLAAGGVGSPRRATWDDYPTPGFANRFGFVLQGYAGPAVDVWTWVLVRNERGGLRVRAAGVFDVWILPDDPAIRALFRAGEGAYEDLWQHVRVTRLPGGVAVLIEEECEVRGVC